MEMVFLGTGAAEGGPSYFCRSETSRRIRLAGGRNIRSRSSFRIDAVHQIDFSPDIFYQMNRLGIDAYELEHVLVTHTHEDHFDLAEILTKHCSIEHNQKPLHVYMSEPALDWGDRLFRMYAPPGEEEKMRAKVVLHPLRYQQTYDIGRLRVTTVRGRHRGFGPDERAINYVIALPDGRVMLYACDTGWYEEDTWEFLTSLPALDLLVLECTFGGRTDRGHYVDGHLDAPNFMLMLERMKEIGLAQGRTRVFASHINTAHALLHDELQALFDRSAHQVTVAWDGMSIEGE